MNLIQKITKELNINILFSFLIINIFLLLSVPNLNLYKALELNNNSNSLEMPTLPVKDNASKTDIDKKYQDLYFYKQLDKKDKEIFNKLYEGINNLETTISIDEDITIEEMDRLSYILHFDCPELFYLSTKSKYKQKDDKIIAFYPQYLYSRETIDAMNIEIELSTTEIIQKTKGLSSFEKEKYIHDYIVNTTEYSLSNDNNGNMYGCLIENKACCKGYSAAFTYLARKCGLESTQIVGTATSDNGTVGHSWNMVKLQNNYYYVDVCWDDFFNIDFPQISIIYTYFNMPYSQLTQTHDFSETENKIGHIPYNDDLSYYLYNNNGIYVKTYEEATNYITQGIDNLASQEQSYIMLQCSSYDLYQNVLANITQIITAQIEENEYNFTSFKLANIDSSRIILLSPVQ